MQPASPLRGDLPLADAAEDLLGFEPLAEGLAAQIEATVSGGLVLEVRARVSGAGRTSFLNLLHGALLARGLPVLRLPAGPELAAQARGSEPPGGRLAPVLLVDDCSGLPQLHAGHRSLVVAATLPSVTNEPDAACLCLELPAWDGASSLRLAERLAAGPRDAGPPQPGTVRAWTALLARCTTPREAHRLADAANAALATSRQPAALVLAALEATLWTGCATSDPAELALLAHVRRFLTRILPLAAREAAAGALEPAEALDPSPAPGRESMRLVSGDDESHAAGTVQSRQARCAELGTAGGGDAVNELVQHLSDAHAAVRSSASHALAALADRAAAPAVRPLLASPNTAVRRTAAFVLGRLRDEESRSGIVELFADPSPETRRAAAAALGRIGGQAALRPLLSLLDESHAGVRMAAETALLQAVGTLPQQAFDAELTDVTSSSRAAAIRAAGRLGIGRREALESLLGGTEAEACAAAEALGARGDRAALGGLVMAAADERAEPRAAALAAISRLTGGNPAEGLARLLSSADPLLRERAAAALGRTGDRRAVPALLALHGEADPALRRTAAASLVRLGFSE